MSRFLLIFILGILSTVSAIARETITGTVVDSKGDPIPGVKVEIPGSSEFVFTDLDGKFQIILREPTKNLLFSYPGTSEMSYKISPEMHVVLGKGIAQPDKRFRYMIDLEGGMGVKGRTTIKSGNNIAQDIQTFVLTGSIYTWGYQINTHVFAGLGFGAYLDIRRCKEVEKRPSYTDSWMRFPFTGVHLPLFLTARYDFGLTKKTAPYVDLRLGCMGFISNDEYICSVYNYDYDYYNSSYLFVTPKNYVSFFIAPSIGYRVSIYKNFGMNFGIRYMTGMKNKLLAETNFYSHSDFNENKSSIFRQRASDVILFNIGFDF